MIPAPVSPLNALPEGVVWVDFRPALADDFEIVNEQDARGNSVKRIHQGPRAGAASGVIVEPAPGYSFRYNIKTLAYEVVKAIPALTIKADATFVVTSDYDRDTVQHALDSLKSLPGYVEPKP